MAKIHAGVASLRSATETLEAAVEHGEPSMASPTPATHAILTQLKAGESVCQADKRSKTL